MPNLISETVISYFFAGYDCVRANVQIEGRYFTVFNLETGVMHDSMGLRADSATRYQVGDYWTGRMNETFVIEPDEHDFCRVRWLEE